MVARSGRSSGARGVTPHDATALASSGTTALASSGAHCLAAAARELGFGARRALERAVALVALRGVRALELAELGVARGEPLRRALAAARLRPELVQLARVLRERRRLLPSG